MESLGLVGARLEAGQEAFDADDEVNRRLMSVVLQRLRDAARIMGRSTPPERTGQEICGASGADRTSHL